MGKKCKKKVQWRQLSLNDPVEPATEAEGECEEEEEGGQSAPTTPTHDNPRPPYKPHYHNYRRPAHHHHHYYDRSYDRRYDKSYERRGSYENVRNYENKPGYDKPYPKHYDRGFYHNNNKFYGRPPFYDHRGGYKFGGPFIERGRRPFRPYGRGGFFPRGFHHGPFHDDGGHPGGGVTYDDEEWEVNSTDETQQGSTTSEGGEGRPSQPVHTVLINNEEYTKIQTPRQEVIFKKSSLDRKRDSIDQGSVTGSMSSGSGASSSSGEHQHRGANTHDQVDLSSVSGSTDDSLEGEDPQDGQQHDAVFEEQGDMFVADHGQPPLAGVVMQQAYPGGPMVTIPVHWTPFIDPVLIPGETALTPLDPAFTHVIDPKAIPIDPAHILPVQHDESGCPVQVQVTTDANGVPIQIEPSAFTVALSSLQPQQLHHNPTQPQQGGQQQHPHPQPQGDDGRDQCQNESRQEEAKEEGDEEKMLVEAEEGEGEKKGEDEEEEEEEEEDEEEAEEEEEEEEEGKREEEVLGEAEENGEDKEGEEEGMEGSEHTSTSIIEASTTTTITIHPPPTATSPPPTTTPPPLITTHPPPTTSPPPITASPPPITTSQPITTTSPSTITTHTPPTATSPPPQHTQEELQECDILSQEKDEEEEKEKRPKTEDERKDSGVGELQEEVSKVIQLVMPQATVAQKQNDAKQRLGGGGEEEEEDEEDEEEEDMLAKESEEGSDSSDSQYASMSESSTTPTTPAGEPSDVHEPPTPAQSKASDNTTPTPAHAKEGIELGDKAPEGGPEADPNAAPATIVQGYVMVPILTPYYDPSVIYGYPVVVADQQQHPQQQQRNYSKRKKKKYQRRRQQDSGSTGYLDPNLYTGEPFVATPGGYVVPMDPASVCHVHGLQYMPQYPGVPHHVHHTEGLVPNQPNYHPEAAQPRGDEQQDSASSGEDSSKTVFSDLQDTERRQIQEILQDRAKVGKSDSTESCDSGVSEPEEAAATECSSDELEQREPQEDTQSEDELNESPRQEEKPLVSEPQSHPSETETQQEEAETLTSETAQTPEPSNNDDNEDGQLDEIFLPCDENPTITQEEAKTDPTVEDNGGCSSINQDEVVEKVSSQLALGECVAPVADDTPAFIGDSIEDATEDIVQDPGSVESLEAECKDPAPIICDKPDGTSNNEEKFCDISTSIDVESHFESKSNVCLGETIGASEASELTEEASNVSSEVCREASPDVEDNKTKSESIIETLTQDNAGDHLQSNISQSIFLSEGAEASPECPVEVAAVSEPDTQCCTISPKEFAQNSSVISENTDRSDNSVCLRTESTLKEEGGTRESSIDCDSLKDLKVTEAVKRWIREVTPEKAFTLSEEVQNRLLSESSLATDLDTEDEYIEDEISETKTLAMDPKNGEGNPFGAASSDALTEGMESCSKRVALGNRLRGATPETLDEYDGASTISNLSYDRLYSEASSSHPASVDQSFDEEEVEKYTENPEIYDPVAYAKYYQLGIDVDETTPVATPVPDTTPAPDPGSEAASSCGSEDIETVPHKFDVRHPDSEEYGMSLATEILKAEKVLNNMAHITGTPHEVAMAEQRFGNPDIYLKHLQTGLHGEVGDSGVQSEESSDEMEAQSNIGSSGVGSSLASTPAISPAHHTTTTTTTPRSRLRPHPLRNLSAGDGPVPCKTVCCAVM